MEALLTTISTYSYYFDEKYTEIWISSRRYKNGTFYFAEEVVTNDSLLIFDFSANSDEEGGGGGGIYAMKCILICYEIDIPNIMT